ncbi:MAG TPA: hypothetical protein VFU23_16190 [Gemmatimonadales bacterium]|nr:hypothetical protein [Gemmatimonadales bacterium]
MPDELMRRPVRGAMIAAGAGAIALVPSLLVVAGGILGFGIPRILDNPFVVLGGLGFALLVNVGASVRWRAEASRDGVRMELDLRMRYRGVNRAVLTTAAALATVIVLYLIGENFGPR